MAGVPHPPHPPPPPPPSQPHLAQPHGHHGGGAAHHANRAHHDPQAHRGTAPHAQPPPPPQLQGPQPVVVGSSSSKVFVGSLPFSKSEADLYNLFGTIGPVAEVVLFRNPATQEKRGAAFVRYIDPLHAADAVIHLDGFMFPNSTRPIVVTMAKSDGTPDPPPPPGPPPAQTLKRAWGAAFAPTCPPPLQQTPLPEAPPRGSQAPAGSRVGHTWTQAAAQAAAEAAAAQQATVEHAAAMEEAMHEEARTAYSHTAMEEAYARGAYPAAWSVDEESYADGYGAVEPHGVEEEGAKLFVGMLPFSRSEEDILRIFIAYGPVAEVALHRNAQGQKKGGAFVRFFHAAHATQALELDGYLFPGSTRAITVRFPHSSGGAGGGGVNGSAAKRFRH